MSNDIKVGDLVQVVRPTGCCGNGNSLGRTFVADRLGTRDRTYCMFCRDEPNDSATVVYGDDGICYERERLKRIPPYSQLEHFRTEESLRRDVKKTDELMR